MSPKPHDGSTTKQTYFLPAERSVPEQLALEIRWAATSPIIEALLQTQGSAMAVLNQHRQIVALNASYLQLLGVADPEQALGLRLGESLGCSFVEQAPSGCGTGKACASCGGALAILVASHRGRPEERDCVIHSTQPGHDADRAFRARAAPINVDGHPWLLLTLNDVSAARRRAALERSFLHDLSNLVTGLQGASELLSGHFHEAAGELVENIRILSSQLSRELLLHRELCNAQPGNFRAALQRVKVATALDVLRVALQHHPAAEQRTVLIELARAEQQILSDVTLLERVLLNMAVNALEATPPGGSVRITVEPRNEGTSFRVWNAGAIPAAVVPRIFQRYFTTKEGPGRGQGTFAMRLFGEEYLGGRVSFTTSESEGTWFELLLPDKPGGVF